MGSHLIRRGGIWWARLAVPASLRNAAGRREFVQSCRTHEVAIAKMVCDVLLARWRTQLLQLQSRPITIDVLKLVGGSPTDFIRAWCEESSKNPIKAFVPLSFELGEAFQFNWSEEGLLVGGVFYRMQVAHLKLCASRAFWLVWTGTCAPLPTR